MADLRWILDDLPVGIWVGKVPTGVVTYVNKAFAAIMGMEAVAGSRIGDVPETYGVFDREGRRYPVERLPFSRVVASGAAVTVDDLVIKTRDRRAVNVRAFASPVRDPDGRLSHVIISFLDITSEITAELGRASTEARLALAVNHAPSVVWSVDRDGIITLSEGAGLAGLGVKSGDLVGKNVLDLYAAHPAIPGFIRRALAGEVLSYSVEVGETVFETWVSPLRDAAGELAGFTAVSNDVSEVRRLRATAVHNDRVMALGTLAASVAHEVNNPLTYIMGRLEQMRIELATWRMPDGDSGAALPVRPEAFESLAGHLEIAQRGTDRIASVMRQLRTFSRPEDRTVNPVAVGETLRSVMRLVGKEAEARARVSLTVQSDVFVLGNEARLSQVVLNLVMNAMNVLPDAAPGHHTIEVTLRTAGGKVLLEVSDSGPGVPAADRERVFEPFFTTKGVGKGTGLGLFVCRNIVRDMGGDISIEDRRGGGATFRVTLPGFQPAPGDDVRRTELTPPPTRYSDLAGRDHTLANVLIIDDDPLVAQTISESLRAVGHQVTTAFTGAQGLRLLTDAAFDVIYCDLMMDGLTGMELAVRLRAQAPATLAKVVFMTGGAFSPDARAFVAEHRDAVVEKPFDVVADCARRLARTTAPARR